MELLHIRNNHLETLLEKISKEPGDTIPDDRASELIVELSLAVLICPINSRGEIKLVKSGSQKFVPAFTSIDDFMAFSKRDYPMSWEFVRYFEFLQTDVEGVIINPNDLSFIIGLDMIIAVLEKFLGFTEFDKLNLNFTHEELNSLREVENPNLQKLLSSPCSRMELYEEMSKSLLFSLMGANKKADKYAENGIIPINKIDTAGLATMEEFGMECGLLFTSYNYLEPVYSFLTNNQNRIVYPHIINIELMVKFIIQLDLDALIINNAHQNYIIKRQELLQDMDDIVKLCRKNVKDAYFDYAFQMKYTPEK